MNALLRVLLALVLLNTLALLQYVNIAHSAWMPNYYPPPVNLNVYYVVDYTDTTIQQVFGNYYIDSGIYNECPLVEALNMSFFLVYDDSVLVYNLIGEDVNITIGYSGFSTPVTYYLYKGGVLIWYNTTNIARSMFQDASGQWYWIVESGVHFVYDNNVLKLVFTYYDSSLGYNVDVVIEALAPPKQLVIMRSSGYVYVDYVGTTTQPAPLPPIQPPSPPPPPTQLVELKGYTSRLLLRNPADFKVSATFTLRAKLYTSLDLRNVTYANTSYAYYYYFIDTNGKVYRALWYKDDFLFLTVENETVTTPLVFVYNNAVFYVNNFALENGKYVFNAYRAYEIQNVPTCFKEESTNRTVCTSFQLARNDLLKPPFFEFNSLYAGYDYSVSKGWVLTLIFSTDNGTFTFYTPLSDILFYGVRVVNITSIDNIDVLAMDHHVLNAYISTASFYYWVVTDNPQLFVFSREKSVEVNTQVNNIQYVININQLAYLSCEDLVKYYNVNDSSMIPGCWGITYASVTNPVNATISDNITVNVETREVKIKNYTPPDWWNIPAWFDFLGQVFTDTMSFIVTSVQIVASTLISTLLNKDVWLLFFVFIIFAHAVIILHNPADLYPMYKEMYTLALTIFKTIYDVVVWLINTVAALIKAIRPF